MKIYIASSWKNPFYPTLVQVLSSAGYTVFDFRAQNGFNWGEVDPNFKQWTASEYIKALSHPLPVSANEVDMRALNECDVCIALHPCGKASHFELGHAVGRGKLGLVFLHENWTIDVIYRNCTVVASLDDLLSELIKHGKRLGLEGCTRCGYNGDGKRMTPNTNDLADGWHCYDGCEVMESPSPPGGEVGGQMLSAKGRRKGKADGR